MSRRFSHRGFTLVEMLVVVGIIAVLVSILFIGVSNTLRSAKRSRALGDFQTIATAIGAYKGDFGRIPQYDTSHNETDGGACILCRALLAPGPGIKKYWAAGVSYNVNDCVCDNYQGWDAFWICTVAHASSGANISKDTSNTWSGLGENPFDGHDGFGFAKSPGGSVYGPYLKPDQFKIARSSSGFKILDRYSNPILYYCANGRRTPAQLSTPEVNAAQWSSAGTPGAYADDTYSGTGTAAYKSNAWCKTPSTINMWEYGQNEAAFGTVSSGGLQKFRAMLGDYNNDGAIAPFTYVDTTGNTVTVYEQPQYTGAYILWSAGPDNLYGPPGTAPATGYKPKDIASCDDIIFSGDW